MLLFIGNSTIVNAGLGLFAGQKIKPNEIIEYIISEEVSPAEVIRRESEGGGKYFITITDFRVLDNEFLSCYQRFANDAEGKVKHSNGNNSILEVDNTFRLVMKATKEIAVGEEIFLKYGEEYWQKHR